MTRCSWGVRLVGIASLAVCLAAAAAPPPPPPRASPEPTKEALEPVQPEWEARGWKAVVPHAYVLRKLLPALEKPETGAAPVFWLKGGTRVPVLVQAPEWWKISWTEGRAGWVRARDVEPHASFILIDTQTGKVKQRLAAKGQYGAVSDGKSLWSIANTGITRTMLEERPVFWSRLAAADQHASLPDGSFWTPDRTHFYVRARTGGKGALLRTDVTTGAVEAVGTPPPGDVEGQTPEGRLLIVENGPDHERTHLYDPATGRAIRMIPGAAGAVTKRGCSYFTRRQELLRFGTDLRTTHRVRLPAPIEGICVSADERFVAAGCAIRADSQRYETHLYQADTLKPVITLKLPEGTNGYVGHVGATPSGWWLLVGGATDSGLQLVRFARSGKLLGATDGGAPYVLSGDQTQLYSDNEHGIRVISTETGRHRTFPRSWRRELPREYLPSSPGAETRPAISTLTLTPDGHTLIITEWLSGDMEA